MSDSLGKATARVGSNIAFIKYWGVDDATLNLPQTNSISMTLANAHTTTTVEWSAGWDADEVEIDGERLDTAKAARIVRHLSRIRGYLSTDAHARVVSHNNFPMASGIASSASGFGALTVAGVAAFGQELDYTRLSALARLASGSASRSFFGGFVEWVRGRDDHSSVARQLYSAEHWDLYDLVAIVSNQEKQISSAEGHHLAMRSPLNDGRVTYVNSILAKVHSAIIERDLSKLGPIIERDALAMHGVMMTSEPSLLYWQPGTLEVMHAVLRWRNEDGLPVYFTIDAGPNVHVICEADAVPALESALQALPAVERVLVSPPGPGPELLEEHLF